MTSRMTTSGISPNTRVVKHTMLYSFYVGFIHCHFRWIVIKNVVRIYNIKRSLRICPYTIYRKVIWRIAFCKCRCCNYLEILLCKLSFQVLFGDELPNRLFRKNNLVSKQGSVCCRKKPRSSFFLVYLANTQYVRH